MTTADTTARTGAPWHFWVVAVVALLWNCYGGYDYTMSHVGGEAFLRQAGMTEPQIAYYNAYPSWMHAVWAIGVWGSVLGSILLLLRSRWAFHAFAVSILGAIGNLGYLVMHPGGGGPVLPLVIIGACAGFVWYSWTMTKQGVLR